MGQLSHAKLLRPIRRVWGDHAPAGSAKIACFFVRMILLLRAIRQLEQAQSFSNVLPLISIMRLVLELGNISLPRAKDWPYFEI